MESALRMLTRRALSEGEIRERLGRRQYPGPEIETVLERLRETGLVDDRALSRDLVRSYREVRRYGRLKVAWTLRARRFPPELVEEAMADASASAEDELAAAVAALRKKFPDGLPPGREGAARAFRFLAGRGFLPDTCRQAAFRAFQRDIHNEEGEDRERA